MLWCFALPQIHCFEFNNVRTCLSVSLQQARLSTIVVMHSCCCDSATIMNYRLSLSSTVVKPAGNLQQQLCDIGPTSLPLHSTSQSDQTRHCNHYHSCPRHTLICLDNTSPAPFVWLIVIHICGIVMFPVVSVCVSMCLDCNFWSRHISKSLVHRSIYKA